jgi:hypothetical protein
MNKDTFKKVGIGIGVAGLALFPLIALAQIGGVPGPIITSPTGIAVLLQKVLNFITAIVLTIALIMLLYAAVLYLGAGASTAALDKAKSVLIYAVVGIVVAILAFSVIPFVQTVLQGNF